MKVYNCSDGVKITGTIPLKPSALKIPSLNKEREIKKILNAFVEGTKRTLNVEPFEKILEGIEFFKRMVPKALERKVTNHEELYYFLETMEGILKAASLGTGMNVFVRGTLRHPLHTLYISTLRLKDFSEIEPAFKEAKETFLEYFNTMMDDLENFIKKYENNYKNLYAK